jgi:hypothetical protein
MTGSLAVEVTVKFVKPWKLFPESFCQDACSSYTKLVKTQEQQTLCGGVLLGAQIQCNGMKEFVAYLIIPCHLHTELFTRYRILLEKLVNTQTIKKYS